MGSEPAEFALCIFALVTGVMPISHPMFRSCAGKNANLWA